MQMKHKKGCLIVCSALLLLTLLLGVSFEEGVILQDSSSGVDRSDAVFVDESIVKVKVGRREISEIRNSIAAIDQCKVLGGVFMQKLAEYVGRHSFSNYSERVLMYSCESDRPNHFCGGMGDRFRGMITVFLLSLLSDRRFEIFHPTPVQIEELLRPNIYNFSVESARSSRELVSRIPVDQSLMRLQRHKRFLRVLDEADLQKVRIVRVQSNSAGADHFVHRHSRWAAAKEKLGLPQSCNLSCYFGCLHRVLFEPTPKLLELVTPVIPKEKFISLQVRMGGTWASGMRIAEPFRTPPAAVAHFIYILQELRTFRGGLSDWKWMKNAAIFVSSDAPLFILNISQRFGNQSVRWIDGGFGHTDTLNLGDVKPSKFAKMSDKHIRENYSLTLANHYILSQGSHFVMAQSGFGDTAFWRSRCSATCLFVDMNNLKTAWQHHLQYGEGASSATAVRNRIVDLSAPPRLFYSD
jgi:hypothetical protein